MGVSARVLVPGRAGVGDLLRLSAPLSFWGGVDPATGAVIDARHPERGAVVAGRVLALPGTIGSSSSSSVLLELVRRGLAPAALVLVEADAILLLGLLVAREMGWAHPPALAVSAAAFAKLAPGRYRVGGDGALAREVRDG